MTESFVIQSDMANLPLVEEHVFHFCRECNVGNYYSAVSVAALQAVENAIVHGNGSDVTKAVTIALGICRGGVFVEVGDEGVGFDYAHYGSLDDESQGQGIFVMKSLSDRMSFFDSGRQVRMEFDVAGIDPADALERASALQAHFAFVAA